MLGLFIDELRLTASQASLALAAGERRLCVGIAALLSGAAPRTAANARRDRPRGNDRYQPADSQSGRLRAAAGDPRCVRSGDGVHRVDRVRRLCRPRRSAARLGDRDLRQPDLCRGAVGPVGVDRPEFRPRRHRRRSGRGCADRPRLHAGDSPGAARGAGGAQRAGRSGWTLNRPAICGALALLCLYAGHTTLWSFQERMGLAVGLDRSRWACCSASRCWARSPARSCR